MLRAARFLAAGPISRSGDGTMRGTRHRLRQSAMSRWEFPGATRATGAPKTIAGHDKNKFKAQVHLCGLRTIGALLSLSSTHYIDLYDGAEIMFPILVEILKCSPDSQPFFAPKRSWTLLLQPGQRGWTSQVLHFSSGRWLVRFRCQLF